MFNLTNACLLVPTSCTWPKSSTNTAALVFQVAGIADPGLRAAMAVALASGHVPVTDQWRLEEITERYHKCMAAPEMPPVATGRSRHEHFLD